MHKLLVLIIYNNIVCPNQCLLYKVTWQIKITFDRSCFVQQLPQTYHLLSYVTAYRQQTYTPMEPTLSYNSRRENKI